MILLDTSLKSISVSLAGAAATNQLQCVASYTDITRKYSGQQGSLNSYVPYTIVNSFAVENDTPTNDTSLVTLVNPPQASDDVWIYSHEVNNISIYNADTASATVTVWLNAAIDRTIVKCTLSVGFTLHYESGQGWYVTNTSGAVVSSVVSSTTVPDGTYSEIVVSSSGTVWTLIASINKAITGIWSFVYDKLRLYNATQTFYHALRSLATANRTVTFRDKDIDVAGTEDKLSAFAATTSAELAGVISDETGGGSLVFGTTPLLKLPVIADTTDDTKKVKFLLSGATANKSLTISSSHTDNRTATIPDKNFTFAGTDDVALKADIASPTFTGTPSAPTAAAGTSTTQIATTAYVEVPLALLLSAYTPLFYGNYNMAAGSTANTYYTVHQGNVLSNATATTSGNATSVQPAQTYIDSADFPTTINGKTLKFRINGFLGTNHTAPTGSYRLALFPITTPASSGGVGVRSYTIGAEVASSTTQTVTTPSADTDTHLLSSSEFTLPSNGWYAICVVTTGTVAANALVPISSKLEFHYV